MEKKYDVKNLKEEFGSFRLITTLTPDTFLRNIIVVSTMVRTYDKCGETAIAQVDDLNHAVIDFKTLKYNVIKKHRGIQEAIDFHIKTVNNQDFVSCKPTKFGRGDRYKQALLKKEENE